MSKTMFIVSSIAILLFIGLMLFCLVGILCEQYPSEDALTYEECTVVKCEKKASAKSVRYLVYVEEYEAPLEIGGIVIRLVNKNVLSQLEAGDKVIASIYESKNKWAVYAMSYEGTSVLSYDDYLRRHKDNDRTGIIILSVVMVAFIGGFIANTNQYRNKGRNRRKYRRR